MKLYFPLSKFTQPFRWILAFLLVASLSLIFASVTPALAACDPNSTITRVSVASDETQGNGNTMPLNPAISADGRYVAYTSLATNLVSGDTNAKPDIFYYDRQTCVTSRISVDSAGVQANDSSFNPSISDNGRYIAFESNATNLVAGDTNNAADLFLHNVQTGQTTLISVGVDETESNGSSYAASISADGMLVAFESVATNLVFGDSNGSADIFVRDLQSGQTTRASLYACCFQETGSSNKPRLGTGTVGRYLTYLRITGSFTQVFLRDQQLGQTIVVSTSTAGTLGNESVYDHALSSDGRYIAFESNATNLVAGDVNNRVDVFVKDRLTEQTTRESISSAGIPANGHSTYTRLSANGRYLAFVSDATNLVSGDTNGLTDLFVRDRQMARTLRLSLAADGTQANQGVDGVTISASGDYVAFVSAATNLVAGDTNNFADVFVVRVPFAGQTPPATLVVNQVDDQDDGVCNVHCSLREAIYAANQLPDANTITFAIPGSGTHAIQPATQLPTIINPVIIDGTTQPGYSGTPLIELRGDDGGGSPAIGLLINAANSTVKGLAINRFGDTGITISGAGGCTVTATFIGTNADGTVALGWGYFGGILIDNSPNNTIGGTSAGAGNVISGNNNGVVIQGASASGNQVLGNLIGMNAAGTAALPNANDGVIIQMGAHDNVIGGTSAGARNFISGNVRSGILLVTNATANRIEGNYIGTDITGMTAIGNGTVASGTTNNNGIEMDATASGNTIGGTNPASQNVISGNAKTGVWLDSQNNLVRGNLIGVNADGTVALPNREFGISTMGNSNTLAGNMISGNGVGGIALYSNNNTLQGNFIGTDTTGTLNLKNTIIGIDVVGSNNIIGGTITGQGNIVAFNGNNPGAPGIGIQSSAVGNRINGNRIFDNIGLGIDLLPGGITANDAGDADNGANKLQNFPLLTSAGLAEGNLTVTGALNSEASKTYRLEFFANVSCDASGNGEGQTYLGFASVTTNGSGDVAFTANLSAVVSAGQFITATATDPANNTSEFSACVLVISAQSGPTFTVNTTADVNDGVCGVNTCSLRDAIIAANANSNINTIAFNIAPSGAATIQPTSELPAIMYPVIIDGTTQPGFAGTPIIELDGSLAGSSKNGLIIDGGNATVRGLVINRFAKYGILIETNGGNTIQGNYIGTDITGMIARGNGYDTSNVGAGIFVTSGNNLFGGTTLAARNVISGNTANDGAGIGLVGSDASNNIIQGNYLGTNAAGTAALGNSYGIVMNSSNSTVGGTIPAARNIISGNTVGVLIQDGGNVVRGNYIGTNVTGTLSVGNTDAGILLSSNNFVSNNRIGGTTVGSGNIIAFNGAQGIRIDNSSSPTGEAMLGNSIFANGELGIDLAPVGINSNDLGDSDTGVNNGQNFPILTTAIATNGVLTIIGTLNSEANKIYRLEFFASSTCDSQLYREGKTYLGFTNVTTYGSGNASFTVNMASVSTGQFITATATDPGSNTSEFSACVPVAAISAPAAAPNPNYYRTPSVTLTWTAVTWATGYVVQWADNAELSNPTEIPLSYSLQSTTIIVPGDGVYHWRVGAKKADGGVVWSAPQKFVVEMQ